MGSILYGLARETVYPMCLKMTQDSYQVTLSNFVIPAYGSQ